MEVRFMERAVLSNPGVGEPTKEKRHVIK